MSPFKVLLLALAAFAASPANAGRIVVHHDEWTLSDTGFATAGVADTTAFAENVANYLLGGPGTGNFLVYSNHAIGLTEAMFSNALTGAGHTVTVSIAVPFNLATLQTYDGVFVSLPPTTIDTSVLIDYVNAGGNVYVAGGTAGIAGGAAAEAAFWNPFLNAFGLAFAPSYNGVTGVLPGGAHPLYTGVSQLYHNNGNTVSLTGSHPGAQIINFTGGNVGLTAIVEATSVPEPSTWLLLSAGLGLMGMVSRRKMRAPDGK